MPETTGETHDPMVIRLVDALESSARVNAEVIGHVKGLEREFVSLREGHTREFAALRETFDQQLGDLEDEMKFVNSHLDNLVRETVVTNQLLREDMDDRKAAQAQRMKVEGEEREWRRAMEVRKLDRVKEVEDDHRNFVQKYADEGWAVLKQPLGYLIAGIIFWVVINWFAVPPGVTFQPPAQDPAPQIEATP